MILGLCFFFFCPSIRLLFRPSTVVVIFVRDGYQFKYLDVISVYHCCNIGNIWIVIQILWFNLILIQFNFFIWFLILYWVNLDLVDYSILLFLSIHSFSAPSIYRCCNIHNSCIVIQILWFNSILIQLNVLSLSYSVFVLSFILSQLFLCCP